MLYNKNNVRKANDKKVLHKVGKQWKVISVALLMAVAGGAVATQANADSNNNGVDASTSAEVTALEQKPAVASATSVAPSSASAKSASAKPSSAISYMNDNGGSAASYHAKASSDNAQYKVNSALVQSYVSSLNAVFPSATNSLNDAYTSAATKTNADKAAAQSYSAIANNKNYSSQVSSLASKANLTYSGFVQSVSYQASNFAQDVSYGSSLNSQMSTVNSYAQLINNIQSNSALSQEYAAKSVSASANFKVANDAAYAANSVYNHFVGASAEYQNGINEIKSRSVANSNAENIALVYAGLDATTTNSLAKRLGYGANSSATSSRTHAIADAKDFNLDAYAYGVKDNKTGKILPAVAEYKNVASAYTPIYVQSSNARQVSDLNVALGNAEAHHDSKAAANVQGNLDYIASADAMFTLLSDTQQEDQYSAASSAYNSELASYASDSASVSSAVTSASAALNSANNSLSSAKSEYAATAILGNHPLLNEIFNINVPSQYSVALNTLGKDLVSSMSHNLGNDLQNDINYLVNPNTITHIVNGLNDLQNTKGLFDQIQNTVENQLGAKAATIQTDINKLPKSVQQMTVAQAASDPVVNSTIQSEVQSALQSNTLVNMEKQHPALGQFMSNKNNVKVLTNMAVVALGNTHEGTQKNSPLITLSDVANDPKQAVEPLFTELRNALSNSNVQKDVTNVASANNPKGKQGIHRPGILSVKSYGYAADNVRGLLNNNNTSVAASAVNSVANSAASTFAGFQSASNSYSNATEENVTLAGIYATSYSDNANSDVAVESNAKNSLDNFYLNHADASYANASSAAASEYAAEPNDVALAQANGVNVFNYAPKYITVVKNCGLYRNTDFAKKAHMMTVPVGTQLKVTGVGFSVNGRTRYTVNYKGHNGYVTSWSGYVQQTYLPTQNNVSVTVTKDSKIYNSAKFTNKSYVGKTLKAGTVLPNVNVVSYDNVYGGVSRLETPSGKFVSANIAYASLNGEADNGNANTNTVTPSHNGVVSYWN